VVGAAVVLTAVGLGGARGADQAGPPPQLVALQAGGALGLVLDFTRGAAAEPDSLRLSVNGQPVDEGCSSRASRDVPPSRVEIACPGLRLGAGEHLIELRLRLLAGGETIYRWRVRGNTQ
jgi:hypothetical protein